MGSQTVRHDLATDHHSNSGGRKHSDYDMSGLFGAQEAFSTSRCLAVCSLRKVISFISTFVQEFSRMGRHSAKLDILDTTDTHTHTQTPGISDQACLLHPADIDKINSVPA